jgi:four helix bundle protein
LVKSVDSVTANLSEACLPARQGFGRYHFNETKYFGYYSRGSLFETKTWLTKANNRKLITENDFISFMKSINIIGVKLNNYINSIGTKSKNEMTINNKEINDN